MNLILEGRMAESLRLFGKLAVKKSQNSKSQFTLMFLAKETE